MVCGGPALHGDPTLHDAAKSAPAAASGHTPLLTAWALLPEAVKISTKQERNKRKKKNFFSYNHLISN